MKHSSRHTQVHKYIQVLQHTYKKKSSVLTDHNLVPSQTKRTIQPRYIQANKKHYHYQNGSEAQYHHGHYHDHYCHHVISPGASHGAGTCADCPHRVERAAAGEAPGPGQEEVAADSALGLEEEGEVPARAREEGEEGSVREQVVAAGGLDPERGAEEEELDRAGLAPGAEAVGLGPARGPAAAGVDSARGRVVEGGDLGRGQAEAEEEPVPAGRAQEGEEGAGRKVAQEVVPGSSPCPAALRHLARVGPCPGPGEEPPGRRHRRRPSRRPR